MLPDFLLESSKSLHVWKNNFIILPGSFVLSLSRALWQPSVSNPRGTCVYSSFTIFVCLLILLFKYSLAREIPLPDKQQISCPGFVPLCIDRWGLAPSEWPVQQSMCSDCGVSSLWQSLIFHQGFTFHIEFRLQELSKGNQHPQLMFSGHFKSFW